MRIFPLAWIQVFFHSISKYILRLPLFVLLIVLIGLTSCEEPTPIAPRVDVTSKSDSMLPEVIVVGDPGFSEDGGSDPYDNVNAGAGGGGGGSGGSGGENDGRNHYGGSGGGGGGGFTPPSSSPASIIIKSSVHDNPKADCVLTKLLDNAQFQQLLKNFQNSSVYNVSFEMGNLNSVTGQSVWQYATSTSVITIDKSSFELQHAIWGATTFFHEAYHAQLQQFAIAKYGSQIISEWPKPINDMTLQELMSCASTTARSHSEWADATHEFMAYNNSIMANGLRIFVQKNFPETYNQIGSDLTKYNYLSLMGLQNTERYKNEVFNQGKTNDFNKAVSDFVSSERPDCL